VSNLSDRRGHARFLQGASRSPGLRWKKVHRLVQACPSRLPPAPRPDPCRIAPPASLGMSPGRLLRPCRGRDLRSEHRGGAIPSLDPTDDGHRGVGAGETKAAAKATTAEPCLALPTPSLSCVTSSLPVSVTSIGSVNASNAPSMSSPSSPPLGRNAKPPREHRLSLPKAEPQNEKSALPHLDHSKPPGRIPNGANAVSRLELAMTRPRPAPSLPSIHDTIPGSALSPISQTKKRDQRSRLAR